jgi:hypothetical protein
LTVFRRTFHTLAVLVALLLPGSAVAGDIALESHAGSRPDDADAILGALITDLERHGFMAGPDTVGRIFESRRSRPGVGPDKAALAQLPTYVDVGSGAYVDANYSVAADNFRKAVDLVDAAPAPVALDKTYSTLAMQARIGLALAMGRLGEKAESRRVMADVVRAHRSAEPSRALFPGSEALNLFNSVKAELAKVSPSSLEVIAPADVTLHLNEVLVGKGTFPKSPLAAGTYRILASREQVVGRIYTVTLRPGEGDRVTVQWELDSVLHTSPRYTGLLFPDEAARQRSQGRLASEVARAVDQKGVVVTVGFEVVNGRRSVVGRAFDSETGRSIKARGGRIWIRAKPPSREQLRELARSLAGQPDAVGLEGLDSTEPALPPQVDTAQERSNAPDGSVGVLPWVGVAGTVTLLGAGVTLTFVNDRCFDDQGSGGCAKIANAKLGGVAALSAGVALGATTGYFWARQGPPPPTWLRGPTRWIIAGASVAAVGAGGGLMAIDRSKWRRHDDIATPRYEYRPTLVVGGLVTAVGAVGLGASAWLLFGANTEGAPAVQPTVSMSGDGGAVGLAGNW